MCTMEMNEHIWKGGVGGGRKLPKRVVTNSVICAAASDRWKRNASWLGRCVIRLLLMSPELLNGTEVKDDYK